MTTQVTPSQHLTIRVHLVNKSTIIATYAVGTGKRLKTGNKVYENVDKKALKRSKLEILNQALIALGDGQKVNIEIEETFLQEFINNNKLKNESYYQDIVDDLRIHLSLCSSVTCKSWISPNLFKAALDEYKRVKDDLFPPQPTYQEIFRKRKQMTEARRYEAAISNW